MIPYFFGFHSRASFWASGRERLRELVLGGMNQHIFESMTDQVLMAH